MPSYRNPAWVDVQVKRFGGRGITYELRARDDLGLFGILQGMVGISSEHLLIQSLEKAVEYAKELCPVGTRQRSSKLPGEEGHLRDSIEYMIEDSKHGSFGSPYSYAGYVNDGTQYMEGYHYLDGALDMLRKDLT